MSYNLLLVLFLLHFFSKYVSKYEIFRFESKKIINMMDRNNQITRIKMSQHLQSILTKLNNLHFQLKFLKSTYTYV